MKLKLFICGENTSSKLAIANAQLLMMSLNGNGNHLEIIDVLINPERAEDARILATPTLIKEEPSPKRMLVGDLSDLARVRAVLHVPDHLSGEKIYD